MLDEPLSALDLKLRKEMQHELKRIQQEVGITFIFVTHDQEEALTMSDKIVVMKDGNIQQIGSPTAIYNEPENAYVANFIGESNIIQGVMKQDYTVSFDDMDWPCVDYGFSPNEEVDIMIRPEDISISKHGSGRLNGEVKSVLFKGVHYEMIVQTKDGTSKTVTMHVLKDRDVLNEEAKEKLQASDFTMDLEDVESLNNTEIIARANAQAWNSEDESDIGIKEVISAIKPEKGKYPVTFKTAKNTEITIMVTVLDEEYTEDKKSNIGIQAFDFNKTVDEIKESMAISVDLKTWAGAWACNLTTDQEIEITDVWYDFDPDEIVEGDYQITFATKGREFKVHSTKFFEVEDEVTLDFQKEDIHVMHKMRLN